MFETAIRKAGFSIRGYCKNHNIALRSVMNWKDGKPISPEYAKKVADSMGMSFDDLFEIRDKY